MASNQITNSAADARKACAVACREIESGKKNLQTACTALAAQTRYLELTNMDWMYRESYQSLLSWLERLSCSETADLNAPPATYDYSTDRLDHILDSENQLKELAAKSGDDPKASMDKCACMLRILSRDGLDVSFQTALRLCLDWCASLFT